MKSIDQIRIMARLVASSETNQRLLREAIMEAEIDMHNHVWKLVLVEGENEVYRNGDYYRITEDGVEELYKYKAKRLRQLSFNF